LLLVFQRHFQQYFSYTMATSFSGGGSRREPPTMGKQLVNFIICGSESSAPFFKFTKLGAIGMYVLLGNPTTSLIEAPRPFKR
jgi:hypothetical protein